jgi:hypothetical protein
MLPEAGACMQQAAQFPIAAVISWVCARDGLGLPSIKKETSTEGGCSSPEADIFMQQVPLLCRGESSHWVCAGDGLGLPSIQEETGSEEGCASPEEDLCMQQITPSRQITPAIRRRRSHAPSVISAAKSGSVMATSPVRHIHSA